LLTFPEKARGRVAVIRRVGDDFFPDPANFYWVLDPKKGVDNFAMRSGDSKVGRILIQICDTGTGKR
jgi:hypothetical protein